jgi:hypothetical protein
MKKPRIKYCVEAEATYPVIQLDATSIIPPFLNAST